MVDSTRNTRKFCFQKRPAEVELMRTLALTTPNALDPYRAQMRLFKELNVILKKQNSDENALQVLRREKEESERPIEKRAKAQRKRREKETECSTKQADEVQGKRRREEKSEKPIEKKVMALRKRRREEVKECPAKQADEVQGKRRREEKSEKPIEKKVMALRKRREVETECPTKQADAVQGKRRREEKSEKPIEKKVMALRKRRREVETECPTKQADEVQGKRRREADSEKPIEKRVMALRKRRREEETECPTKQADEVQRKRRREKESEKPIEKRAKAQRKRRREEETESPTEQEDEVQRKKSREEESWRPVEKRAKAQRKRRDEESERPVEKGAKTRRKGREEKSGRTIEKRAKALRKGREEESERLVEGTAKAPKKRRRGEETESPTEQADEIQRKSKEKESEKPVEKRAKAPRKRRREEETECPAEQADEVPRNKSRARKAEKRAKAPRKRGREKAECPVKKIHKASGKREEGTEHPAEKLDKTAQKKGDEEKTERRKQELTELLIKIDKEKERSRQEQKRMEKEARIPGCLYPESFIFHKRLGSGSQGKVMLATHCDSGKLVAVKIVKKWDLYWLDRDTIINEREVMKMVMGHPYCTKLFATFQSEDHLFYVMEFYSGGDLSNQIESKKLCDLPTMRCLAAELLCGLQYAHSKGVLYGGVKPDNVLLDCNGHVRLADFGISETNMFGSETRTGMYGSELYMAPEISKNEPFDQSVDYFALGITLFEAAFGIYPFNIKNPQASICQESPRYPIGADDVLVDFLNKLLCKDQKKRKVYIAKIRKHRFFRGINWEQLEAGETHAPFSACRKDLEEMTKTTLNLYRCLRYEKVISSEKQEVFMGFEFVSDEWKAIKKKKTKNTRQKKKLN